MPEGVLLAGWARTAPTRASIAAPVSDDAVVSLLAHGSPHGLVARGLGRSYGDAAQCAGGTVVDTCGLADVGDVDPETGIVEVGAGTSLQALLERSLPSGWFVPVTPGTRQVTVGGAIAADVHGKNHHRDGSFGRHVASMVLATPTGVHEVGPERDPDLHWSTCGGMGLTGVVTRARVRMLEVETGRMVVDTDRYDDLEGVMSAMEAGDSAYRYSVAWVDCTASGRRSGRSVLTRAEHARREDLPVRTRARAPEAPGRPRLRVLRPAPRHMLNALSITAFNDLWFRRAPRHRVGELQRIGTFFHPLDAIAGWNLLYGDPGFVQYQFVVGPDEGDVVARSIALLSDRRIPSFLAVLKRFGPASPGPLSFPVPGWTLALDIPIGPPALSGALDELDQMVAAAGGRVYLAKDSRLRPDLLRSMYPRLDELAAVRRRVDPEGVLRSDLSRRLGLDEAAAR
jgi:decaprenylphospho-beta-D-ribofuranose 2-oxidase